MILTVRPGQYKVPRIKIGQLLQKSNTTNHSENLMNDNSLVHSRSVSRSDLNVSSYGLEEINKRPENRTFRLECTPTSSLAFEQKVHNNRLEIPTVVENYSFADYDISQKLEDFVVNRTPRKLIKNIKHVTPIRLLPKFKLSINNLFIIMIMIIILFYLVILRPQLMNEKNLMVLSLRTNLLARGK